MLNNCMNRFVSIFTCKCVQLGWVFRPLFAFFVIFWQYLVFFYKVACFLSLTLCFAQICNSFVMSGFLCICSRCFGSASEFIFKMSVVTPNVCRFQWKKLEDSVNRTRIDRRGPCSEKSARTWRRFRFVRSSSTGPTLRDSSEPSRRKMAEYAETYLVSFGFLVI